MSKGKAPSMLSIGNGQISISSTIKACKCARCKIALPGATPIALMKCSGAGFARSKRLCLNCAAEIIAKTQSDLDAIKAQF